MNTLNTSRCLFSLMSLMGVAGLLAACGSEGAPSVSASGSGSGSASASGIVTDFGSVFINGKKFEAENVEVWRDGVTERCTINPVTTCGFKKGMVVTVSGSFNGDQRFGNDRTTKGCGGRACAVGGGGWFEPHGDGANRVSR